MLAWGILTHLIFGVTNSTTQKHHILRRRYTGHTHTFRKREPSPAPRSTPFFVSCTNTFAATGNYFSLQRKTRSTTKKRSNCRFPFLVISKKKETKQNKTQSYFPPHRATLEIFGESNTIPQTNNYCKKLPPKGISEVPLSFFHVQYC